MNYAAIKKTDIANGDGVRVSIWVSGCPIHCEGCFNKDLWDYNYGKPFTDETINEILIALKPDYISGLTILGGEPLCKENIYEVTKLIEIVKKVYGPSKTIWLYSGLRYEQLAGLWALKYADILVDGPFIFSEKDITLNFRGSRNQRIINLREGVIENR